MAQNAKNKFNIRTWLLIAVGVAVAALALLLFLPEKNDSVYDDYSLAVHFVDVEQGDGIVIRCEDAAIVIDGGESEMNSRMSSVLRNEKISALDCYIATHPHSDHIGAAASIIERFHAKSVMMTAFSEINAPTSVQYEKMTGAVLAENSRVIYAKSGDAYDFGSLHLDVFSPAEETGNYNDMSIVIKVTYKGVSFLLTGDAEETAETQMLEAGCDLKADVLKVGHHGGSDATGEAFLAAVAPEYAVISCGYRNEYGHPSQEVLTRLQKHGIMVFRTDQLGTVSFYSDGKRLITPADTQSE